MGWSIQSLGEIDVVEAQTAPKLHFSYVLLRLLLRKVLSKGCEAGNPAGREQLPSPPCQAPHGKLKHMWPFLKAREGTGDERDFAVVANLSARVGSIGDNRLGGWHSYRNTHDQELLSFHRDHSPFVGFEEVLNRLVCYIAKNLRLSSWRSSPLVYLISQIYGIIRRVT
ncbi:hypothetical protein Syun_014254 [Stephania yunnanensis]|uniref:Uncharacterized protein n=1 Tax=Stephania yunnanensis TaxID=152371 RepID=A0AAP0JJ79_9MAGN